GTKPRADGERSDLQTRRRFSVEDAARGRLVACEEPRPADPAVFRERVPARPRSVRFRRGDELGDDGAGGGRAAGILKPTLVCRLRAFRPCGAPRRTSKSEGEKRLPVGRHPELKRLGNVICCDALVASEI